MTLQHLKEEWDITQLLSKEIDVLENAISDKNHILAICSREEIWKLVYRLVSYKYNTTLDLVLHEIKNSPKTFGLLDKEGRGGAILVSDIEEIISKLKQ